MSEIPEAVEEGVVSWETYLAFSERLRSEMERQASAASRVSSREVSWIGWVGSRVR